VLLQPRTYRAYSDQERRLNTLEIRRGAKTGTVHGDKTSPTVVPHIMLASGPNLIVAYKVTISHAIAKRQMQARSQRVGGGIARPVTKFCPPKDLDINCITLQPIFLDDCKSFTS